MAELAHPNAVQPIISTEHKPTILWIGCSDARVPESVIYSKFWPPWPPTPDARVPESEINLKFWPPTPEQIFVHRNIANQFHLTDNNAISVLTYGVTGIKNNPIKEVYVVGHTDCGGVAACYNAVNKKDTNGIPAPDSVLWAWLGPLRELAALNKDKTPDELAVINVKAQIQNVRAVLSRLGRQSDVEVKGYIYDIALGNLVPVSEVI